MVSVNKQTCIGCGACAATCPEVFEMKNGKSHVRKGQEKSKAPCVKESAAGCPVGAVKP